MSGEVVNVHEAKSNLSRLLERVEGGERITLARAGRPIADLVPHPQVTISFGAAAGRIEYEADQFDAPLEAALDLFEGA